MRFARGNTSRLPASGGQRGAALAATCSQNGAAGAGAHAQTEAMRLGTTTVVGLESPLGHDSYSSGRTRGLPPLIGLGHLSVVLSHRETQLPAFAGTYRVKD